MRINAANNIDFGARLHPGSSRVFIRIGWQRFTATPAEAYAFARQLVDAADAAKAGES